jgi:hypothetical protein
MEYRYREALPFKPDRTTSGRLGDLVLTRGSSLCVYRYDGFEKYYFARERNCRGYTKSPGRGYAAAGGEHEKKNRHGHRAKTYREVAGHHI